MMSNITLTESDVEKIKFFYSKYKLEAIINTSNYISKSHLGTKMDSCRFCGATRVSGSFSTDSHTIPQLLGNRYLLSHYECDDCNKLFSSYDDSLGNYLGLYRTMSLTKGRKIPKFKDEDSGMVAMAESDGTLSIILPNLDDLEKSFESKEWTIKGNNKPHIPIHTFK